MRRHVHSLTIAESCDFETQQEMSFNVSFFTTLMDAISGCRVTNSPVVHTIPDKMSLNGFYVQGKNLIHRLDTPAANHMHDMIIPNFSTIHRTQGSDLLLTILSYCSRNILTQYLVHVQHVQVNPTELYDKRMPNSGARSNIGLQDVT